MASTNPISPKVIAGGIGSIVLPLIFYVVGQLLINLNLIEGLPPWLYGLAATLGSVLAAYGKTDPLRVPTVTPEALDTIND